VSLSFLSFFSDWWVSEDRGSNGITVICVIVFGFSMSCCRSCSWVWFSPWYWRWDSSLAMLERVQVVPECDGIIGAIGSNK
jgi:hypothetical protein